MKKWAILIDPSDINGGPKGYVKLDISVVGKGDGVKPTKSGADEDDDIESNLLLPENTPSVRPRANFSVRIYKAEGLPIMNAGIVSGVKKIFTGDVKDLVDPYVQVWFGGQTGKTSVKKNRYDPEWNEQVVFSEMFPPLCRRIKLQLKDKDSVVGDVIGTSFIDLAKISNDGNEGFEPTFGPSWINLYGSTRQYNTVDANRKLNEGFGRGCMFRGRLLVALKTDIQDSTLESGGICVTNESCLPISETAAGRKEEFFLFGTIFAASMIDASVGDKPILFEFSIGNFGNQVDGRNVHVGRGGGADSDESDEESGLLGHEHSDVSPEVSMPMTPPMAPRLTNDKNYYYLPIDTVKPNIFIKFPAEESRRRLYNRNILHRIAKKLEEGVVDVSERLSKEKPNTEKTFRNVLQDFIYSCQNYSKLTKGTGGGSGAGKTKLDKERQKWLAKEMEELAKMAKEQNKGKKWTNKMIREKMKAVRGFLSRVKFLADEPQDSIPDVFLWMIAGGKRVAFARIPAEKLIYSVVDEENGERCGQMQTVFLRLPGKKGETAEGWAIQAKLELYLWLGMNKHRKEMIKKLPKGYDMTADLKNCVKPTFLPPPAISYNVTNTYQMRCHIYQARSLVGSDSSGLSDPFARVVVMDQSKQTKTIEETLSPTWDEVLILDNVTIHGDREDLKDNPPLIAIEVFDVDVGSGSEFIGRTLIRPVIKLTSEPYEKPYFPPMLQWHHVYRGTSQAGELLAAVEMIQLHRGDLPADVLTIDIPQPDPLAKKKKDQLPPPVPIPDVIKPKMCKYRIEILCWGMREVKRLQLMTVDKPRVDIECGGATISSAIIPNAQKNPNFPDNVRVMDVELPESEFYCPPLTFRVVDCRQFGRFTLVGTHVVNSLSHFKLTNVKDVEEKRGKRSNKGSHESMNVRGAPALEDSSRDSIATDTVAQLEPSNQNEGFELNGAEPNPEPPTSNGDVVITMADPKPPNGNVPKDSGSGVPSEAGDKQPAAPGAEGQPGKPDGKDEKKKKKSDDEENTLDWWSRYYATVATMQKEQAENPTIEIASDDHDGEGGAMKDTQEMAITPVTRDDASKDKKEKKEKSKGGGGGMMKKMKKSGDDDSIDMTMFEPKFTLFEDYSDICKLQIYPNELESVPEFHGFKEWLHTFDILRGKNTGDEDSESRVVGKFKGSLKLYKWPLPKEWDARKLFGGDPVLGFFQGLPLSEPIGVLVRVYIVKANDLHPTDVGGKADPYVFTQLGKQKQNDKENYISKNLNPVFGKCFEFEATFPMESRLVVQIYDWDLIGSDDLIGETVIDLENRFYSKHRATCGFCSDYATFGYNNWRDPQKPSMILKQLCKDNKLDPPAYSRGKVVVNGVTFLGEEFVEDEGGTKKPTDEHVALEALKHWHEIPGTGARKIVPEHVETRPLYSPEKPGIEQGRVEMWVDMFPMDMPLPGAPIDISPRKPKKYELRVIIWNTDEVVLADDAFLTGEKMSDIFVKGWLNGPNDDQQSTDIHYRSLTGEGNFNWRFIYQFEYLAAEEKMVIRKKESTFSVDETEYKVPPRLMLQVWDADSFSADDFLGSCTLDLNRFPRGAKTSKKCTPDILKMDGTVPLMNLFKLKRHKGWWPFMAQSEHEEEELTGKVEAEMHLMTEEEAEKSPAGLARDEPDPLEKPNLTKMKLLIPLVVLAFSAPSVVYGQSCAIEGCFWSYVSGKACQCNTECHLYGNCCSDYYTLCGSCANRAGDVDDTICHCSASMPVETRCQDYLVLASCSDECTPWYDADLACQCTSDCDFYGNCCEDFQDFCVAKAISTAELSQIADSLWSLDTTRLIYGTDYTYDVQTNELNPTTNTQDQSFSPFFTSMQSSIFELATIKSFLSLMDNFNPALNVQEVVTYSERDEAVQFWDAIMATQVMIQSYTELNNFNFRYESYDEFRGEVEDMWYGIVNHGDVNNFPGDTNGFENHFLYEEADDLVTLQGGYSWIQLYQGEQSGALNYHSYKSQSQPGTDQNVIEVQFSRTSDGKVQPSASVLMGSSPEFDIAMAFICFKNLENGGACNFDLNGVPMNMVLTKQGFDNSLIADFHFV
ncbi:otoferlin-like isoform X3 [Apostichopus japonicus]